MKPIQYTTLCFSSTLKEKLCKTNEDKKDHSSPCPYIKKKYGGVAKSKINFVHTKSDVHPPYTSASSASSVLGCPPRPSPCPIAQAAAPQPPSAAREHLRGHNHGC